MAGQKTISLSRPQIQQVHKNMEQADQVLFQWNISPEETAFWEAELEQEIRKYVFEDWFRGVNLTPEQEEFARAEVTRDDQAFHEMVNLLEAEGSELSSLIDDQEELLDKTFYARLAQYLSSEQIQQVQDNRKHIMRTVDIVVNLNA